jgi:hypothetical protein
MYTLANSKDEYEALGQSASVYIIMARRMISGLVLKYQKGELLVMVGRYPPPPSLKPSLL